MKLETERWLDDCRREASELVRLGAWTQAQADKALAYLRDNANEYDNLSTTEALDLARDLT